MEAYLGNSTSARIKIKVHKIGLLFIEIFTFKVVKWNNKIPSNSLIKRMYLKDYIIIKKIE